MNILELLLYIGIVVVSGFILHSIIRISFMFTSRHYAFKLLSGMPWMKWMTFDETVALGCPEFFARRTLCAAVRKKMVEARLAEKLPEDVDRGLLKTRGLYEPTAHCFEYRRMTNVRRRPMFTKKTSGVVTDTPAYA